MKNVNFGPHMFSQRHTRFLKLKHQNKKRIKLNTHYSRLALHLLFWTVIYQFFIYLKKPLLGLSYWDTAWVELKDLFVIIAIFYFLSYYIVPHLLIRKKFILVLFSLTLIYYFYAIVTYLEFRFLPELI